MLVTIPVVNVVAIITDNAAQQANQEVVLIQLIPLQPNHHLVALVIISGIHIPVILWMDLPQAHFIPVTVFAKSEL